MENDLSKSRRRMLVCLTAATLVAGFVVVGGVALAQDAEKSLNKCQQTASKETGKYIARTVKTVGVCLQKISKELILKNAADTSGAAKSCVGKLRKIVNTEQPEKTLEGKLRATLTKACDPNVNSGLAHQEADVLGTGVLPQQIDAQNLNSWCQCFGGDGTIGGVNEWVECLALAASCQARQAVSVQYPRALEWLDLIRPAISDLDPAASDPKVQDALTALDALNASIDGTPDDHMPDIRCGVGVCGNGVAECVEQCDGADLQGKTCLEACGSPIPGTPTCGLSCELDCTPCGSLSGIITITN